MKLFKEIEFNSWNKLKSFLCELNTDWCFRGQSDYKMDLVTTMDRIEIKNNNSEYKRDYESYMIREFKRHTEWHYNKPHLISSNFQIVSLMQHHGAPTRLLDFTTSPYVASFFAIDSSKDFCSIYAINYMDLQRSSHSLFVSKWDDDSDQVNEYKYSDGLITDNVFDKLILGERQFPFVELVLPFSFFERLIRQQGVFLCQGDINSNFETNLLSNFSITKKTDYSPMYKIKIPIKWKMEILKDLNRMNINHSTLFPDLDGFFKSLKNTFDVYSTKE
ncbi:MULTISPECIES: FRG domain-containing protein [Flavobacteriaceae]|uniref:FRG domain-containing protein n=2 Tax=Flavobacteriaceae TaxID=49546 RepID=A0A4Y8AQC8_9FLAO|nr:MULTISPECIES: FRG domain-containing protein [Flavobacteriaceae]TEW72949.1 FRG domain-containing protein [Gramella jeungdoensis]GGK48245.1 hypothetical protein GCM10007963_15750 [Lutibacter litoralis]